MATPLMIAGTALQFTSAMAAGKAAQKAANYNASINERNAKAAEIQAEHLSRDRMVFAKVKKEVSRVK